MNKIKVWYVLLVLTLLYQGCFLYSYLTEQLADFNLLFARTYWITAGVFGVIVSAYIIFKVNTGFLGKIIASIVMFLGIGLISLWLLALAITSM